MAAPSYVRPPRLRPGDVVAIVNPSQALPGSEPLQLLRPAVTALEALDLAVRVLPHVGARWRPPSAEGEPSPPELAGTDEQRAADINAAFRDGAVRMVLTAWGGGGADRLLQAGLIDWQALAADPKVLCGFSDFTHLALTAHQQLGLVTIDGPSALQWAAPWDEPMLVQARAVLMRPEPYGAVPANETWYASQLPPGAPGTPPTRPRTGGWRWLRPGQAQGRAVVAMPSIHRTLVAAGVAPSLSGAIWCLDPYRASPAQVEDWLRELVTRGVLDGMRGCVVARPWPGTGREEGALDEVILRMTETLTPPPPVLADVDLGHTWPKWTVPNGVLVSLDSDADHFAIDGPAVA